MNSETKELTKTSSPGLSAPGLQGIIFVLVLLQICLLFITCNRQSCKKQARKESPDILHIGSIALQGTANSLSPYGPGLEYELITAFCKQYQLTPKWHYYPDLQSAQRDLASARIQILVAPGFAPPDEKDKTIQRGPVYAQGIPTVIHYKLRYGLLVPTDLCRFQTLVVDNPCLHQALNLAARMLGCRAKMKIIRTTDIRNILSLLSQNQSRFALVDSRRFKLWEPFYPALRKSEVLPGKVMYCWYWKKSVPLHKKLRQFWAAPETEKLLQLLQEKYFAFLPDNVDYFQIKHLQYILKKRLPLYRKSILQAAKTNNLDPLFLIAVIYQESHFDPWARSETGVVGMLQLTQDTAQDLGLTTRSNPLKSIKAGSAYLRILWNQLQYPPSDSLDRQKDRDLDNGPKTVSVAHAQAQWTSVWDRWFVTLAAYNLGLGHARDAILLARDMGQQALSWRRLKKIFPLLSSRHYYKNLPNGYARGYQAVDYVEKIRYYYYILNGLALLPGTERDDLRPFLRARPLNWPD